MPALLLSIVILMLQSLVSTLNWATEDESVTDMIIDNNIDSLHKHAEILDGNYYSNVSDSGDNG
jgi:hypothetical protein